MIIRTACWLTYKFSSYYHFLLDVSRRVPNAPGRKYVYYIVLKGTFLRPMAAVKTDKLSLVRKLLEEDVADCLRTLKSQSIQSENEGNLKVDEVLKVLEEVTINGRVSFGELEEKMYNSYNERSRAIIQSSLHILKNRRRWIEAVESPVIEHSTYYLTAAGLSAVQK